MVYASGNVYDGDWKNDIKCGVGTMQWKGSRERYSGEWADGYPHGHGEHVWLRLQDDASLQRSAPRLRVCGRRWPVHSRQMSKCLCRKRSTSSISTVTE